LQFSIVQFAQQVLETEADAVRRLVPMLGAPFERAVRAVAECSGAVLTSGIGKAGHVARKLAASFSSTGTPSHFLNPAEALHGDLGSIRKRDVVLIMSYSGESDEILRMLSVVKRFGNLVIAMTSSDTSGLGQGADIVLPMGKIREACPLGLAPSATTTAMAAMGDALFLSAMKLRAFTAEEFALYHPAGQLGRKLLKVKEAMTFRRNENLPVASDRLTVGQVLHEVSSIKRRSGAVILIDADGKVSGIFSDGDLRRAITDHEDQVMNKPISAVMTKNPKRIRGEQLASEAIAMMRPYRIDELPVVDDQDRPIGLIDIQDLIVLRMLDAEDQD
jgi:arabinose-5-phosphate isomerase